MKRQLSALLLPLLLVCFSRGEVSSQPLNVEETIRGEVRAGFSTGVGTLEPGRRSGPVMNKRGHGWSWALTTQTQSKVTPVEGTTPVKWTIYSSTPGRFNILFPGQPTLQEQPIDSAVGKVTNYVLIASLASSSFLASYADYPTLTEDPQAILDRVRDGVVGGVKGTLVKSTAITHKGYPGREFQTSTEDIRGAFRIYLVNNRLYQLAVIHTADASTEQVKDFLNSFDLKVEK